MAPQSTIAMGKRILSTAKMITVAEDMEWEGIAEKALAGWTRLQEERCDVGEWVQLRNLIADAVDQAVEEKMLEEPFVQHLRTRDEEITRLTGIRLREEEITGRFTKEVERLTAINATMLKALEQLVEDAEAVEGRSSNEWSIPTSTARAAIRQAKEGAERPKDGAK